MAKPLDENEFQRILTQSQDELSWKENSMLSFDEDIKELGIEEFQEFQEFQNYKLTLKSFKAYIESANNFSSPEDYQEYNIVSNAFIKSLENNHDSTRKAIDEAFKSIINHYKAEMRETYHEIIKNNNDSEILAKTDDLFVLALATANKYPSNSNNKYLLKKLKEFKSRLEALKEE